MRWKRRSANPEHGGAGWPTRTNERPGVQKLSGAEHTHRIRLGDYRVVYEVLVAQKAVVVQRVRHRKDVYR